MRINTLSSGLGAAARGTAGRQSQLLLLVSGEGDGRPGETVLSKAMSEAQKASRTVLSRLDEVRSAASEQRKAAAQQKLELARKKLQMLRMLSGDPKMAARQAKQIAQDIREAAREYGAAAGSGGTVSGAPEAGMAAGQGAADPAAATPGDKAGEAGARNGGTEAVPSAEAQPSGLPGADGKPEAGKPSTREEAARAYQDTAAKLDRKAAASEADREVLDKFKQAADEAKRLIEEAVRKLKARKPGDGDAREAEAAARAMVAEIDKLADAMGQAATALQAGGAADGLAPPVLALNILA